MFQRAAYASCRIYQEQLQCPVHRCLVSVLLPGDTVRPSIEQRMASLRFGLYSSEGHARKVSHAVRVFVRATNNRTDEVDVG